MKSVTGMLFLVAIVVVFIITVLYIGYRIGGSAESIMDSIVKRIEETLSRF